MVLSGHQLDLVLSEGYFPRREHDLIGLGSTFGLIVGSYGIHGGRLDLCDEAHLLIVTLFYLLVSQFAPADSHQFTSGIDGWVVINLAKSSRQLGLQQELAVLP